MQLNKGKLLMRQEKFADYLSGLLVRSTVARLTAIFVMVVIPVCFVQANIYIVLEHVKLYCAADRKVSYILSRLVSFFGREGNRLRLPVRPPVGQFLPLAGCKNDL